MSWGLIAVLLSSLTEKGLGAAVTLALPVDCVLVTCCLCLSFPICSSWAEDAVAQCKHMKNTVTL